MELQLALELELALEALSGQHLAVLSTIHTAPRLRIHTRRCSSTTIISLCPSGGDSIDPAAQSSRWRSRTRGCTTWPRNRRRPSDSSRVSRCVSLSLLAWDTRWIDHGQRFPIPTEFALLLSLSSVVSPRFIRQKGATNAFDAVNRDPLSAKRPRAMPSPRNTQRPTLSISKRPSFVSPSPPIE